MPPLRGSSTAAAVLDDRPASEMDRASLDKVAGAQGTSALELHSLTADLTSSCCTHRSLSVLGTRGQCQLCGREQLSRHPRRVSPPRGLPARLIQWGVLGRDGNRARDATLARYLEQMGISAVNIDDALLACVR